MLNQRFMTHLEKHYVNTLHIFKVTLCLTRGTLSFCKMNKRILIKMLLKCMDGTLLIEHHFSVSLINNLKRIICHRSFIDEYHTSIKTT